MVTFGCVVETWDYMRESCGCEVERSGCEVVKCGYEVMRGGCGMERNSCVDIHLRAEWG